MPVDAFTKSKDPKDEGSEFLTKEDKAEIKAAKVEKPKKKKK